jgi:hypothetical protein
MARTDLILQKVQNALGDPAAKTIDPRNILVEMDSVQYEISQEALAIERNIEFTTEAGESIYDLGTKIYKIDTLIEPTTWLRPTEIVTDNLAWKTYSRDRLIAINPYPLYVFVFDDKLRFLPAPQVTGDKVQIIMYLYPEKKLVPGSDPEVPIRFDLALQYGTLARFKPDEYELRYRQELATKISKQLNATVGGIVRHAHWSDTLNF